MAGWGFLLIASARMAGYLEKNSSVLLEPSADQQKTLLRSHASSTPVLQQLRVSNYAHLRARGCLLTSDGSSRTGGKASPPCSDLASCCRQSSLDEQLLFGCLPARSVTELFDALSGSRSPENYEVASKSRSTGRGFQSSYSTV